MDIRPYQNEALRRLDAAPMQRFILSLPTGTGKTFIAAHHAKTKYLDRGRAVLWIAHSEELLDQAHKAFVHNLGMSQRHIGRRYAGYNDLHDEGGRNLWLLSNLVQKGPSREPDLIVIDEAHHAASSSYLDWLSLYRAYARNGPRVLGLTATPYRLHEGEICNLLAFSFSRPKTPIFEEIAYKRSFCQLAAEGFLAPFRQIRFDTDKSYGMKLSTTGDFTGESLEQLNNPHRNQFIVKTWRERRQMFGKTLVFVGTQAHAKKLGQMFGPEGSYVISDEGDRSALEAFRRGHIQVLVNVGILKEGVDVPDIRTVILARPTTSAGLFTQMVGRGSRILPGKPYFNLVDIHDQLGKYESYLAGAMDLADRDPSLLEVAQRRATALEHVHKSRFRTLGEVPGAALDLLSHTPDELIRSFEGWIDFWSGDGKQASVAMLLEPGEFHTLHSVSATTGELPPDSAERVPETTSALQRTRRALCQGLTGRLHPLTIADRAAIADLREEASISLSLPSQAVDGARSFARLLQARGAEWGVSEASIGASIEDYVRSRTAFAGAVRLVTDGEPYLRLVGSEVLNVLREAVQMAVRGELGFADAPRIQANIEKAQPDLSPHGQRILQAISEAKSLESFCVVAA